MGAFPCAREVTEPVAMRGSAFDKVAVSASPKCGAPIAKRGAPLAKRVVSAGMQGVAHKVELCMKCSVRPGGNACARRPKKSAGATAALPFAKLQSPLTKLRCARCGRCVLAGMGERTGREVQAPRAQWARGTRSFQIRSYTRAGGPQRLRNVLFSIKVTMP